MYKMFEESRKKNKTKQNNKPHQPTYCSDWSLKNQMFWNYLVVAVAVARLQSLSTVDYTAIYAITANYTWTSTFESINGMKFMQFADSNFSPISKICSYEPITAALERQ